MLYPLKFKSRFKERIWGGRKLEKSLGKKLPKEKMIGESWELSGVPKDFSVVANGILAGNNIQELVEVYMGDLVGERVFEEFGEEFPLLVKFLDVSDILSIQVHPDNRLAAERHNAYGKTEMWYVMDAGRDAFLYLGLKEGITREDYLKHLEAGTLVNILNRVSVKPGEAYFIPAGTIHAIGKGVMVVEIQQTSDITYRVFDWNRLDKKGKRRELHTELALDAINFEDHPEYNITVIPEKNKRVEMGECLYFSTGIIQVDGVVEREYVSLDSFIIYVCLEGELTVVWDKGKESLKRGETMLIPAQLTGVELCGSGKLIEVYMPEKR